MQPAHHQIVKPGRRIPRKSLRLNIHNRRPTWFTLSPLPVSISFVWLAVFVLTLNLAS